MNTRVKVVIGLLILSIAGALATGWKTYYNLSYVWAGLLIISYGWSRIALSGITLRRHPRSLRSQVGRIFEETFVIRNSSRMGKLWIELRDHSELPGHRASSVMTGLGGKKEKTWVVRTLCTRRGRFRVGTAEIHSGDPFGLFPRVIEIKQEYYLVVLPRTERIHSFVFPAGRLPGGDALQYKTHQVTPNAAGVREYAPGDSLNRIHWKTTARRQKLMVKEFEFDPQAEVWILLDANAKVQVGEIEEMSAEITAGIVYGDFGIPKTTEEYAVAVVASLALYLLERDRDLGFISHGKARHIIQSDRGEAQLYHILESLAVLEARGEITLPNLLKVEGHRIPRGASVVMVTSSVSPQVLASAQELKRKGLSPVLILIDAESFGGDQGSQALLIAAQSAGISTRLIRYDDSLAQELSPHTTYRKWIAA